MDPAIEGSQNAQAPLRALQRLAYWSVGAAAVLIVLWLLGRVLLLVFAAALLAVVLRSGSDALRKRTRWPSNVCLAIVSGSVVLLIAGFWLLVGPQLSEQSDELWDRLTQSIESARQWLARYSWGRAVIEQATPEGVDGQQLASSLGGALMSVFGAAAGFVIAVVVGLYFAVSPGLYVTGLVRLLPKPRRRRARAFLSASAQTLRQWLAGQGIGMLIIALASYAGLALIGVPMAPLLAVIIGLTDFVPYVGPIVGAAVALVVALGEGLDTVMYVAILLAGVQFVQGNFVEPMVQRRMTRLPPALTILSQTVLGTLFGVLGVILATPLLAVILVGVRMLYVEDVLKDRPSPA